MKRIIAAAALMAAIATSVHAESYTYMCRVPSAHKSYPVKVDIDNATLTWRGTTFRNLRQVEGCRAKYQATLNGVTAELCTATQGAAAPPTRMRCALRLESMPSRTPSNRT
jgi:hypothetical protein